MTGDVVRAPRRPLWVAWGVVLPVGVFVLLAALVAPREPGSVDRTVFAHLYSGVSDWPLGPTPGQDNPFLERVMPQLFRLTDDRELALLVGLALVGLVVTHRVRAAVFAVAVLLIGLVSPLVKKLFDRGSPFPLPGDNSFPSGHGMATMAIAAVVVVLVWRTRWSVIASVGMAVFALAIGAAVIADGGHWLSDVIAGWCLAIVWTTAVCLVVSRRAGGEPVGAYLRARSGLRPGTAG